MPGSIHSLLSSLDRVLAFCFQNQCLGCGRRVPQTLCDGCRFLPLRPVTPGERIQSALHYEEPWRTVLHQIKFHRSYRLLSLFDPIFIPTVLDYVREPTTLVPIPIHVSAFSERGFNQSDWLARRLSQATGLELSLDALAKTKSTPAQSTLSLEERKRNLKGVFRWTAREAPPAVVLVDDVWTTGQTLRQATDVLLRAGVARVYGWTLFRA